MGFEEEGEANEESWTPDPARALRSQRAQRAQNAQRAERAERAARAARAARAEIFMMILGKRDTCILIKYQGCNMFYIVIKDYK